MSHKTLLLLQVCLIMLDRSVTAQKPNIDIIINRRQDVYIAGFFPFGKGVEYSSIGRGVMPSVKLALDHVNEHDTVLRNYRLHMWWNDTECNAAVGVKSFFDMMHSGPHKLMLFGAACTHVTDPIAKASKHWHLTQLSYADTHPMFTKEAFPNFFRIVPSENAFNAPRIALLQQFNWTRVGTIYQNEPRYALAHNRLVAELETNGFVVIETQSFATEVTSALEKLKENDVRIILGNFNETWALRVFCEAYKLEMYGRAYTWLIQGTYSSRWWRKHAPCSRSHLTSALDTVILTDLLPLSTTGELTVSGITAKDYEVEYDRRRGGEYSRFHGYTYDGVWAMALAIQNVAQKVKQLNKERGVHDFKYRDKEWESLFLDALANVSFEGVTGPVRFYNNERKASILLKQFQGEDFGEIKVGEYCTERSFLDLSSGMPFKWIGKYPPKDRTVRQIEHTQVNITIYAIMASCSVLGILLACGFLAMNIHFRNQRYIKMSSPHLNNLIIVGCMLTYMSVIFLGLDSSLSSIAAFPYICTARAWLLMAGFSLAFGAMFSKTWRVHSIFTDVKLNKKVIKDYQLFMVVGVLLSIDIAIMTTWQVSDPFYRATKQMDPYPHPHSEDILVVRENEYCQSEQMNIFIGVIYAYKGLLLVFGAFLAWETRHVSIPALNDSKHIGLSVYNVLIMCIMGAAIALVLSDHKDALFVLIAIFIIFCTTGTLCLVFVPKLVELRRNGLGAGNAGRIRATLRPASSKHDCRSPGPELERKIKELRQYNNRYKRTLQAKESELQMLLNKLGSDANSLSSGKGSRTPPSQSVQRLSVPSKEPTSHMDTSDITSICSLTASQGADAESLNILENNNKEKINPSAPPHEPIREPIKREQITKNVSFKNHLDFSENHVSSRPVPEKDQLAKLPYGWSSESQDKQQGEPFQKFDTKLPLCIQKTVEIPQTKSPAVGKLPTVAAVRKDVAITPGKIGKEVMDLVMKVPNEPAKSLKSHRRTSSIGQSALISDLMHVSVDQDDAEPPIGMERKVIGAENESPVNMIRPKHEIEDILERNTFDRRSACSQRRDSERRKKEYIVVQSDLWDTNTFTYAACAKSPTALHAHSPIQRSVSEKRQQTSPHKTREPDGKYTERRSSNSSLYATQQVRAVTPEGYRDSETLRAHDRNKKRRGSDFTTVVTPTHPQNNIRRQSSAQVRSYLDDDKSLRLPRDHESIDIDKPMRREMKPAVQKVADSRVTQPIHHKSTPNVASQRIKKEVPGVARRVEQRPEQSKTMQQSMSAARSESELLEVTILPIFHKLVTERHQSLDIIGLSCPNINIKCDIVEYL